MKELSIEQKAKAYDEALERAIKHRNNDGLTLEQYDTIDLIFPELQQNDDEKIREKLIENFKWFCGDYLNTTKWGKDDMLVKDIIIWLEKQGNIDKISYEIAEKEKYDFVSGQFIECRKSFNEFKEGNSYWLEYAGNDNYIGRSDNILNQKFHITPRQLYRLFTQQHFSKENNTNEETNAPTEYDKYVDECLNEASKHFFSDGEDKYSVADLFYAGVRCGKSWLEKQGNKYVNIDIESMVSSYEQRLKSQGQGNLENNPLISQQDEYELVAKKVEPKFKVGDWVVFNNKHQSIYQVEKIEDGYYILRHTHGGTFRVCVLHDKSLRLWTTQDAKDGDVLVGKINGDKYIIIFKRIKDVWVETHGHYNSTLNRFCMPSHMFCRDYQGTFTPATQEQRDLLFKRMKEKGYEKENL